MSSANEHLAPPPKPRMSPLDFRNTDLVSRLLAATPPYLYNMSLLPNTYFFSEMLRSFVQAKTDSANRSMPGSSLHGRRPRKRAWNSTRTETSQKPTTSPKPEQSSNDWQLKNSYLEHRIGETPLELTTRSVLDNSSKVQESDNKMLQNKIDNYGLLDRKTEIPLHNPPVFPSTHTSQDNNPSNLILPPPPPMWYPPLYPTAPYGIDPLHFFIDLRVSGHIYDRKNQKESSAEATDVSSSSTKITEDINRDQFHVKDLFKQSRHTSAFSVPVPHTNKNTSPINLSHSEEYGQEQRSSKFDVKSMGFDKSQNKNGTNYIMSNIGNIFKNVDDNKIQMIKNEENVTTNHENETEEQKQKRVKDLRALIGLELVVDYMNHAKPQTRTIPEESSSTDMESVDSPTVEVVALHDET